MGCRIIERNNEESVCECCGEEVRYCANCDQPVCSETGSFSGSADEYFCFPGECGPQIEVSVGVESLPFVVEA